MVIRVDATDQLRRYLTLNELQAFLDECREAGADMTFTTVRVNEPLEAWIEVR